MERLDGSPRQFLEHFSRESEFFSGDRKCLGRWKWFTLPTWYLMVEGSGCGVWGFAFRGLVASFSVWHLQGYLAPEEQRPPRTLQQVYA